jgi:multidrug resistance protein, MATE family
MFLSYQTHLRQTFIIAYPVMLSQLGHILVSVADSMMVGQLGAVPLAAVSLSNGIFALVMMFGIGLSMAMTPLIAAAEGEHNQKKEAFIFRNATFINLCAGLLLCAIIIFASPLLRYFDQPEAVVNLTLPYLRILAISLIPLLFFQTFKQYAEGLSFTRTAMFITIGANLLNVSLNYVFIYGKFGLPEMGLNGAGWSTLVSRIVMAVVMAWYVYHSPWFLRQRLIPKLETLHKRMIRKLLGIGVPLGFQYIFEVSAFSMAAILMGWLGTKELAAHQIALNLAAVSYMMATGIGAAATVRVGNQLGKTDIENLRKAGFAAFMMGIVLMSISALLFITANHFLPTLYIDEPQVIDLAASLLIIAAFFQLSDGVQAVGLGALRGLADVKIPTLITLLAYWVVSLPLAYWLAFPMNLGSHGVWYGLLAGLTFAAIFLFSRFLWVSQKLKNTQVPKVAKT